MDINKKTQEAYNKGAHIYSKKWVDIDEHLKEPIELLKQLLPKNATILDVGCGHGKYSHFWHKEGHHVLGVDFSENMLNIAKQKNPKIDFKLLNMHDLHMINSKFDLIWISYALLHIQKEMVPSLVKSLHHLLKKGGYIFIATSLADETQIEGGDTYSIGLVDSKDENSKLPYVSWAESDLIALLQNDFDMTYKIAIHDPFKNNSSRRSLVLIAKRRH